MVNTEEILKLFTDKINREPKDNPETPLTQSCEEEGALHTRGRGWAQFPHSLTLYTRLVPLAKAGCWGAKEQDR